MNDDTSHEDTLPFGISEADILKEMAELTSEGWTAEQILRLSAVLVLENEMLENVCLMHQDAFYELHEKYQISERNWQVQWKKKDEFFRGRDLELYNLHNEHINVVIEQAKEVVVTGIAEAFKNTKPEVLNPVLERMVTTAIEPATSAARLAGEKEASVKKAKHAANSKHEKTTYLNKTKAFTWFEENAHRFPRNMDGCAEAATKEIALEFSTLRKYLRLWKSEKKRNM
jgi:hypothetical protein